MTRNLPEPPPFPWKCRGCQEWAVTRQKIEYYIETRQNNRLCSVFIPELEILKCGRCGELLFTEQVDAQVNEALRKHLERVV